jgi:hypothetical protein
LPHLKKEAFHNFFEHLNPPFTDLFDGRDDVQLKVKIVAVAIDESREIVKPWPKCPLMAGWDATMVAADSLSEDLNTLRIAQATRPIIVYFSPTDCE